MDEIGPSSTPRRRAGVLEAVVDDELVLLAENAGRYHGLDPVGVEVWRLLDGTRSVDQICAELVGGFAIDVTSCRSDVLAFLADLSAHDLIDVS